jgi:hypothetical protein
MQVKAVMYKVEYMLQQDRNMVEKPGKAADLVVMSSTNSPRHELVEQPEAWGMSHSLAVACSHKVFSTQMPAEI